MARNTGNTGHTGVKNRGIRARILGTIWIVATITCGAVAINYYTITKEAHELQVQARTVEHLVLFSDVVLNVKKAGLLAMDAVVDAGTGNVATEITQEWLGVQRFFAERRSSFQEAGEELGRRDEVAKTHATLNNLGVAIDTLFSKIKNRTATPEALAEADDVIDGHQSEASRLAQELSAAAREQYRQSAEKLRDISRESLFWSLGANVTLLGTLLFLGIRTANGITRSTMKPALELEATVKALSHATSDLDRAGHTLAGTATEQNASVTETVSAMTEIQSIIRRATEHSHSVVGLAGEARNRSEEGSRIMQQMSQAMAAVKSANSELEKIVKIIQQIESKTNIVNNIAFKTQVLSFNASIEAARAGANGRGFAVVAMEVGRLADVSGKAAEEISALLRESVTSVSDTVEQLSAKVGEASHTNVEAHQRFEKIVEDISAIHSKIGEIEHGIREQSAGVDQCVKAMHQLSIASQANDDLAKEISVLSGTLRAKSKDLENVAQTYNTVITGVSSAEQAPNPSIIPFEKTPTILPSERDSKETDALSSHIAIDDDAMIDHLAKATARLTQEELRRDEKNQNMRKSA